jgi:hypothetical protein
MIATKRSSREFNLQGRSFFSFKAIRPPLYIWVAALVGASIGTAMTRT